MLGDTRVVLSDLSRDLSTDRLRGLSTDLSADLSLKKEPLRIDAEPIACAFTDMGEALLALLLVP